MKSLFDQTQIKKMKLKNRFIRSSVWMNMADEKGHLTKELKDVYQELSKGGVSTIFTGYAFVTEDEQPNPGMLGIYDDSFIEEYKKLTKLVHQNNTNIVLQIAYGGSQSNYSGAKERVIWGPSAVENKATSITPKRMTKQEIKSLVKSFGDAAIRTKKANFDGVQIHGAHGYLLSQFLTPYYNQRTDKYGGSINNRARIIFEVYDEIRSRVGKDYPVLIKINCSDFMEEGLTLEESKFVCRELAKRGIDAIEITGGSASSRSGEGASREKLNFKNQESYFREEAAEIAEEIDIPTILVGGNRSIDLMEEILNNTSIEYFSLARPLLAQPDLIHKWSTDQRITPKCISCNQCKTGEVNSCIFNKNK